MYTGKNPGLPATSKDVNEYQLINFNLMFFLMFMGPCIVIIF